MKIKLLFLFLITLCLNCGRTSLQDWIPQENCGNGILNSNEECDDGNVIDGDGCSSECTLENQQLCGNGIINAGEQCDDGNRVNGDGCNENCQRETNPECGNGIIEGSEECDDGNRLPGDGCDSLCQNETTAECGNWRLEIGEECDDGNTISGDGCDVNCQLEGNPECGNGVIETGEQCDDWNVAGYTCEDFDFDGGRLRCALDCTFDTSFCESGAICGNWRIEEGEECDDGNTRNGDGCDEYCQWEELPDCGDGNLDDGEACDDGNNISGDGCSADCRSNETCGNRYIDLVIGEACDDGNNISGDGCSADCRSDETCGNNYIDTIFGEECDDGNRLNNDGCDSMCHLEVLPECGDGNLDDGEVCDDGNNVSGDGCSADCRSNEICGNGYLDTITGEICDDGNIISGDGCSYDCLSTEICGNNYLDTITGEECDDGNRRNNDGCDQNCHIESCEPDLVIGTLPLGVTISNFVPTNNMQDNLNGCGGSIGGEDVVLRFSVSIQADLQLEIAQMGDHSFGIYQDTGGLCNEDIVECFDPMGNPSGNIIYDDFEPGTYFLIVDAINSSSSGNVWVDLTLLGQMPDCGNGNIDENEVCDDGNTISGDGCSADCLSDETCGNGYFDSITGEQCDDGNNISGDGCSADCRSNETCGNGYIDTSIDEVCDDGNRRSGDGCSSDCLSNETCGNHYIDTAIGEECDDGNTQSNDGCDYQCHLEAGLCYVDQNLGVLVPGSIQDFYIDISRVGDEWVTSCAEEGSRDYVLTFEIDRYSDVEIIYNQNGNHAMGLYTENQVTDVCLATGGICFAYDPNAPGDVIFMGRSPGIYYLTMEAQGQNGAGTIDLSIYVWGCLPDNDMGFLSNEPRSVTVDTSTGSDIYEPNCGTSWGRERVIAFQIANNNTTLIVQYEQTGDNLLALFKESGGRCDANQVSCYDPQGVAAGTTQFSRLQAGSYILIVEAFDYGYEGNVELTLFTNP